MSEQNKTERTMRDSLGRDIPIKYVSAYDKARDRVARRILDRFNKTRRVLERTVAESLADLESLKAEKENTGAKGNFAAQSFDGLIRVAIRQQYFIRLDERVTVARDMMLNYVNDVLNRVDGVDVSALRLLVAAAFKVNADGFLSTGKVISLLRMEVNDQRWREAKQILQSSLKSEAGKRYLSCETRPDTQRDFTAISLNAADCWPR